MDRDRSRWGQFFLKSATLEPVAAPRRALLSLRDPDVGDVGATLRGIGAGGEPSSGCGDAVVG